MYGSVSRLIYFSYLYEQIKDVDGAVVECGVGWGNSLLLLGFLVRQEQRQRTLYGFDSFGLGYPVTAQQDGAKAGALKTTERAVEKLFKNSRCEIDPVLVSGFFSKTLDIHPTGPVAFVHLACDLYTAYREAIDHFYPLMKPRAVMTFDEYGSKKWPGATRAVDQFIRKSGEPLRVYAPLSTYYITKERS